MADETTTDSTALAHTDASMAAHTPVFAHTDVLTLIEDVERSLNRLREQAGDEAARAKDADQLEVQVQDLALKNAALETDATALETELSELHEERATLLERHLHLESQLASSRAMCADAETRLQRAHDECTRVEAAALLAQLSMQSQLTSTLEERALAAEAAHRELSAKIQTLEREIEEARVETARVEAALIAAASIAAANAGEAESTAINCEQFDETDIALAAEARIQQMVLPKLMQLAQAAAFLRTRKNRLAAVRQGLRHRSAALRVLRQIYSTPRLDAGLEPCANAAVASPSMLVGEMQGDRLAIAQERQELVELRDILAASEDRLSRRAHASRFFGTTAIVTLFMSVSGALSWHAAGVLAPPTILAHVELQATSRAPESQQTGAVDATVVGAWLRESLSDDTFIGAVSSRLSDRGRLRAESEELAANLSDRASVEVDGSTIRVSLRGDGAETTVATLDAIATTAYVEANRSPERRSDQLKIGIANATREVGRTVFSHAEAITDHSRVMRAGMVFGAFTAIASLLAGAFWLMARRASRTEVL